MVAELAAMATESWPQFGSRSWPQWVMMVTELAMVVLATLIDQEQEDLDGHGCCRKQQRIQAIIQKTIERTA